MTSITFDQANFMPFWLGVETFIKKLHFHSHLDLRSSATTPKISLPICDLTFRISQPALVPEQRLCYGVTGVELVTGRLSAPTEVQLVIFVASYAISPVLVAARIHLLNFSKQLTNNHPRIPSYTNNRPISNHNDARWTMYNRVQTFSTCFSVPILLQLLFM